MQPNMHSNTKKQVEQFRTLLRDLFGIVHQEVETLDLEYRKVVLVDPWPVGVDKRLADERLKHNGFALAPLDRGPYSSAYWI